MLRSLKGLYHLLVALVSVVWFRYPSRCLTVIGVTGTDGKTTTTTLIYEILKSAGFKTSMITSVHAVIAGKSYDTGFHVTTPNAWWIQKYLRDAVNHGDSHIVLEVTSHALSQYRVLGVKFEVGVLTNITHEHLDWHRSFEKYLFTKLSLLTRSKKAVINRDADEIYTTIISKLRNKKLTTYGIRRDASVTPVSFPFETELPGIFNQYNCLAAIGATLSLDIDPSIIRRTIQSFKGISGRMEMVQKKPFTVIIDFAHTPNAIEEALKTARQMTKKNLIHVFGSAGKRDATKRPFMGEASSRYADCIVLTEEDYRDEDVNTIMDHIAQGIARDKHVERFPNRVDAVYYALKTARPGDLVIITGKGHEQSLCRGSTEYPWSDQKEVRKMLRKLGYLYYGQKN